MIETLALTTPADIAAVVPVVPARARVARLTIVAAATVRASWAEIGVLRKQVPAYNNVDLPGHFFKHSDEQTVVSMAAVSRAIEQFKLNPAEQLAWGIVAAPRYPGRMAGGNIIRRFRKGAYANVSPHVLAQHSLHSVSGAISVVTGIGGPNFSVGGGPRALVDGLLSAITLFDAVPLQGAWLVASAWNPEPYPGEEGPTDEAAACQAVAFALTTDEPTNEQWTLSLERGNETPNAAEHCATAAMPTVSELASCLFPETNAAASWIWKGKLGETIAIQPNVVRSLRERKLT
jgi:hypothetical protein